MVLEPFPCFAYWPRGCHALILVMSLLAFAWTAWSRVPACNAPAHLELQRVNAAGLGGDEQPGARR